MDDARRPVQVAESGDISEASAAKLKQLELEGMEYTELAREFGCGEYVADRISLGGS